MSRRRRLPAQFWVEAALASLTAILTVVTLISREWIEALTGWDPDHGSGAMESLIVAGLAAATAIFGLLARARWAPGSSPPVGLTGPYRESFVRPAG